MLLWLNRFRNVLVVAVLGSGLSVVLAETWFGGSLPGPVRLTLRSAFWVSALLWVALRLSMKRASRGQDEPPSK